MTASRWRQGAELAAYRRVDAAVAVRCRQGAEWAAYRRVGAELVARCRPSAYPASRCRLLAGLAALWLLLACSPGAGAAAGMAGAAGSLAGQGQVRAQTIAAAAAAAAPAASAASAAPAPQALPASSPLVRSADGRLLAPDIGRIVARGELVVALSRIESPPFFADKNGKLVGTDIDLVQAIAAALGVKARYARTATADVAVEMVGNGEADLAVGRIGRTIRRSQMVLFSTPYQWVPHAMLIHRVRFAELYGKRPVTEVMRGFSGNLGVLDGTSWVDNAARDFPAAPLRRYADWARLIDAVRRGEVVAAYRDELSVRAVLDSDPRLALTLRTVTFSDAQVALSVVAGVRDTTLVGFVNEVIAVRTRSTGHTANAANAANTTNAANPGALQKGK